MQGTTVAPNPICSRVLLSTINDQPGYFVPTGAAYLRINFQCAIKIAPFSRTKVRLQFDVVADLGLEVDFPALRSTASHVDQYPASEIEFMVPKLTLEIRLSPFGCTYPV
jgi:hypothetical protein